MKPHEVQKQLINIAASVLKSFEQSNDIDSPSLQTYIDEEFDKFDIDLDELREDHAAVLEQSFNIRESLCCILSYIQNLSPLFKEKET